MKKHKRILLNVGRLLAVIAAGAVGLVLLLGLLLRVEFGRDQVRKRANAALADLFQGQVIVDRIGQLGMWGVAGVDARVLDANGHEVIRAQGLRAELSLFGLVKELVAGGEAQDIELSLVACDFLDVALLDDGAGAPTLAGAFEPRVVEPETEPSGAVNVRIGKIAFERVWVHGLLQGAPLIDAELTQTLADLHQSSEQLQLRLQQSALVARALPQALDPSLSLQGEAVLPSGSEQPMKLRVRAEGSVAQAPIQLHGEWLGDDVQAVLDLPAVPANAINTRVAGLAVQDVSSLQARVSGTLPRLAVEARLKNAAVELAVQGHAVVEGPLEVALEANVSGLDVSRLVPDAPVTQVALHADLQLFQQFDTLLGKHRIEVLPSQVAGEAIPGLLLDGSVTSDETSTALQGKLRASEPGLELQGTYAVSLPQPVDSDVQQAAMAQSEAATASPPSTVSAQLDLQLQDPQRLRELGLAAHGTVAAQLDWNSNEQISADVHAQFQRLRMNQFQVEQVRADAQVQGTVSAPRASAQVALQVAKGRVRARGNWQPAAQELSLKAQGVDLVTLEQQLGAQLGLQRGQLDLELQVTRQGQRLSGSLSALAKALRVRQLQDGQVRAQFKLDRNRLNGEAEALLGNLGQVQVSAVDLAVPPALDSNALKKVTGELRSSGQLRLNNWSPLLAHTDSPVERVEGNVSFDFVARSAQAEAVELSSALRTRGLRVVQKRPQRRDVDSTDVAVETQPLALEGIDFDVSAQLRSAQRELTANLVATDRGGKLVELCAQVQLPSSRLESLVELKPDQVPVLLRAVVSRRRLQGLPDLIRPNALRGLLNLDAQLEGTVTDPRLRALARIDGLRTERSTRPMDVRLDALYSKREGQAQVDASSGGARIALVAARWHGDLQRVAEMTEHTSPVAASAEGELRGFPLDLVPGLAERGVQGVLSGDFKLQDWGRDAHLSAQLQSKTVKVDRVQIHDFTLRAQAKGTQLSANTALRIGQAHSAASLTADMSWGSRAAPQLSRNAVGKLQTRDFELRALGPLLGNAVSEISGRLNADAALRITPGATQLSGKMDLKHGVLQLPAVGQRFSDIQAEVSIADNQIVLQRLSARGTTGRVMAEARAQMDGFELRSAQARIDIPKAEKLPITLEGVALGDAYGVVTAKYTQAASGARRLQVDVPRFHLFTPETGGYGVQSLEDNPDIRIGVRRADGKFAALPVQPLEPEAEEDQAEPQAAEAPLLIVVNLDNVTVQRGRTATAQLRGALNIQSGEQAAVTGRIEVRGGRLDVQGKTFDIERGVITFDGKDPGNPTITATARWDSPTDHAVYAEYTGDVETGRIKLRSEPPLTQDEIASLLLFGTPDGGMGSSESDEASMAVSVAGDTVAKGLNQALSDFTTLDVSARVDTSTGSSRPELVFQVTPRLAAKVSRAVGEPTAGESPDRTFLTLELRLKRAWALSAVLGDRGATALDLIWRRRY